MRATAGLLLVALLSVGCESLPPIPTLSSQPEAVDPGYETCDDPAWERAERAAREGRFEEALADYRAVVESSPLFVFGHQRYQDLALQMGGEVEAEMRAYYAALPDAGKSPLPPYTEARLHSEFDELRQELLQDAVERDPAFYFAYLELARMWRGLERTQNELAQLERAFRVAPKSAEVNLALARALSALSRNEEAAPRYKTYLKQRPDDREATREYARLLIYQLGRSAEAKAQVDALLAEDDEDAQALMDAAALAWLDGDRERAAEFYRRVIRLKPDSGRAVLNLGNLYYQSPDRPEEVKRRDWPLAREAYRTFLAQSYSEDLYDLVDVHVTLPYRLQVIDAFLGPLPADAPTAAPVDL